MGWSFAYGRPSPTIRAEMDRLHCWQSADGVSRRVLKSAMVGTEYYAAIEISGGESAPVVFAAVCLTSVKRDEWGYKGMSDDMGPRVSRCPKSILALLTPTDSEYANAWRARCAEHASRPKYAPGQTWRIGSIDYVLTRPVGMRRGWVARSGCLDFRIPFAVLSRAKYLGVQS